jgi:Flp pilus assembly protein TadG
MRLTPGAVVPLPQPTPDRDDRRRAGQSLVEFALVLPILLIILFSIIQLGMLFGSNVGLINAVREAARYGSLSPTTASNESANGAAVDAYLRGLLRSSVPAYRSTNLAATSVTYCRYLNPGGTVYSVRLLVSATYGHPLFVPIVSTILDGFDGMPNAYEVTTSERFRVENPPLDAAAVSGMTDCP